MSTGVELVVKSKFPMRLMLRQETGEMPLGISAQVPDPRPAWIKWKMDGSCDAAGYICVTGEL